MNKNQNVWHYAIRKQHFNNIVIHKTIRFALRFYLQKQDTLQYVHEIFVFIYKTKTLFVTVVYI